MQPLKPLGGEALGLGGGIGVEHGGVFHHAFLEADANTVFQVDGGEDDHGFRDRFE
jgi:hypothetical protein